MSKQAQETDVLSAFNFVFDRAKPRDTKKPAAKSKAKAAPTPTPAPKVEPSVESKPLSANAQLAKSYVPGSGADCPFCMNKGLISPSNGVIPHPKREDVLKQTFASCKHTINVAAQ